MKYKSIELESPPLGEVVVAMDAEKLSSIGYFYISQDKQLFCDTLKIIDSRFKSENGFCYVEMGEAKKWANLPKFKSIKTEPPPFGIEILLSGKTKGWRGYNIGVNLKDDNLEDRGEDVKLDSWIEMEAFKEDNE